MNASAKSGRVILIVTGTDVHPFTRLRDWADRWAARHPEDDVLIQHGFTPAPAVARGVELLTPDDLRADIAAADVVISHGGPGTISSVRAFGIVPIIVPRDPAQGEHVDDHQMRFARWAADHELGVLVLETTDLDAAVESAAGRERLVGDPRDQIDESVDALGARMQVLARGGRTRWSFPSLHRRR